MGDAGGCGSWGFGKVEGNWVGCGRLKRLVSWVSKRGMSLDLGLVDEERDVVGIEAWGLFWEEIWGLDVRRGEVGS